MLVTALGPAGNVRGGIGFEDLPPQSETPAEAAMHAVTEHVWARLHGPAPAAPAVDDPSPRVVILSISDGQRPAKVVHAGGMGLLAAAEAAASKLPPEVKVMWLRLDVVTRVAPVTKMRDTFIDAYRRDHDGLAIGEGDRQITLLSTQLLNGGFVDDKRLVVDALRLDVPGFAALWEARPVRLQRFNTVGMVCDGRQFVPLMDGYRNQPDPTADQLLAIAQQAGRYLTRAVNDEGRFDYMYQPVEDSLDDDYNLVRHAGAIYAMAELYAEQPDPDLLAAIRRATAYLLRFVHTDRPPAGPPVSFIIEDDHVGLGGGAVSLLALSEVMIATGDKTHQPIADQLADWIISQQDETGHFPMHQMSWPDRRISNFYSQYYPGEAILSLLRFYSVTRDARLLKAATRGARYRITSIAHVPDNDLEHDHWLLYACNDLTRHVRDPLVRDYCARLTRAIAATQHDGRYDPLWAGGWYVPPRSTPAATRAEGLGAARLTLRRFDDEQSAALARDVMQRSITYQLRTFVGPERAMFFKNPARALGAFTGSLDQLSVRIDFNQHNISALLARRRILLEKSP